MAKKRATEEQTGTCRERAGSTGNPPQALKLTAPRRGTIAHRKYRGPAAERGRIGAECLNASRLMSLGEACDRSGK